jgi:SAM-dependent methyltransferase
MMDLRNLAPFSGYPFKGEYRPCVLCGTPGGAVVSNWDRRLKRLRTVCCEVCGLVRTDPMPTDVELDHYYGAHYRADYQFVSLKPPKRHLYRSLKDAARRRDRFAQQLGPNLRVLDFGSGSGEFLHLMTEAGHACVGIEPGRLYADFARETYGVEVHAKPYGEVNLARGGFDLITANHVIEHLRDPSAALEAIAGWLKDDGVAFIAVPDITASTRPTFERLHFAHVFNFTPSTLEMAACKAGLEPDPRFPDQGTTRVFRKARQAAPCAIDRETAQTVLAGLPLSTPGGHIISGRWVAPMAHKVRRWFSEGRRIAAERPVG